MLKLTENIGIIIIIIIIIIIFFNIKLTYATMNIVGNNPCNFGEDRNSFASVF